MRKLQPELRKIKQNSNGNKQLESIQMMDLYRKHNVKPFRSVLSLLIQIPIIITLFNVVRIVSTQQSEISKYVSLRASRWI